MKISQVAAQLYSIRDYTKTPADIKKALEKIRAIGYTAVQVSGMGPIPEAELVAICAELGLTICATHEGGKAIVEETDAVIARLKKLHCRYTAYPYPHVPLDSAAAVKKLAAQLDAAGAKFRDAGMVLTYHNHHIEFQRFDGKTALDIIYDETGRQNLQSELDTYWVQAGGQNPAQWVAKLRGRLPLLHLKGFKIINPEGKGVVGTMGEIGNDNLNWVEIIAAAESGATEWYIVEQDTSWLDDCPFKALQFSFQFIRDHLVGEYNAR
jgi:sugar phosphate isomerase/epimerase